jgi:branched-chain amino acid transport system permease protein
MTITQFLTSSYFLSYIALSLIYVIAALSTNLLVGIAGIFSVSQAAVFGVGAYIVAYLTMNEIIGFVPAALIAAAACVVLNVIITLPSLRVLGDYFVVTSFGIQLLATAVFMNWTAGTGGAQGLPGIPAPVVFGYELGSPREYLPLAFGAMLLACLIYWLLMRAPFGRLLRAIREDEPAVLAAGKSVLRAKVEVSAVAGAFAGVAGALYGNFLGFVEPATFDLNISILMLTMVALGGARTLVGSIAGAFFLLALPQAISYFHLVPNSIAGAAQQIIYGLLLIAFMVFRPQGLFGEKL